MAACAVIARGIPRRMDLGEIDGRTFVGIACVGFDSDANRIANEAPVAPRQPRVRLRRAARAVVLAAGALPGRARPSGERVSFTGYTVAPRTRRAFGGGMFLAPDALLDDGLLDVVAHRTDQQARVPVESAQGVPGYPRRAADVRVLRAAEMRIAPIARSRCMPTAIRSASCPCECARCRARSGARLAGRASAGEARRAVAEPRLVQRSCATRRRLHAGRATPRPRPPTDSVMSGRLHPSSRSRGPSARSRGCAAAARRARPGKVLMRLDPDAIGALGGASGARQRADIGDQRQDHHRRDGSRRSSPARASARAQPRGREHGRRHRHRAARRARPRARIDG